MKKIIAMSLLTVAASFAAQTAPATSAPADSTSTKPAKTAKVKKTKKAKKTVDGAATPAAAPTTK